LCPFKFFVGSVLKLEPREEPTEGLDVRQLGNVYHRIFERIYQAVEPSDLGQLLAALPDVAQEVLDAAPQEEGFRETAWWRQTCDGIVDNVRRSLEALAEMQVDFVPSYHEAKFGLGGEPPLVVRDGEDSFRVRGLIDRVDRAPDGRVRVIDYKTGGPWSYTKRALVEGKKLQVPLYALAHAERSSFTLSGFDGGVEGAMAIAVAHAWKAVHGSREGRFVPDPPDDGCPSYCPAAGFCWRYRARKGG